VTSGPIRTRAALDARLAELPAPRSGYVRTYRGQTQRYPKLLATKHRSPPSKRDLAWALYAHIMAGRLAEVVATTPEEGYASLDDLLYWFEAIKQHYGPGSPFIDVSHSVDVALWFALHESRWIETSNTIGPGSQPGVDIFPVVRRWLAYRPVTGSGWLYVLDVPRPDSGRDLSHGTFVDLRTESPAVFGSSMRIQAQHACLVLGDDEKQGGDLSNFLACDPIAVAVSVAEGAPWLGDVHAMFPTPEEDPWYARFLDTPHCWDLDGNETVSSFLAPALGTTIYAPSTAPTEEEMRRARARFYVVPAPLVLNHLVANGLGPPGLAEALGVVLEGPILLGTPPMSTGQWHEEALWRGIGERVALHDGEGNPLGMIPLDNLLFEFSPLERADWDRFGADDSMELLRAVWLRRHAEGFEVCLVLQRGRDDIGMTEAFLVVLDAARRRIGIRNPGESGSRMLISDLEGMGKPILHALLALHHLTPDLKVAPLPHMSIGGARHLAMAQGAVARLERARLPCLGAAYLRMRNVVDGHLYLGGGTSAQDTGRFVEGVERFGEVPYSTLVAAFRQP